MRGADFVYISAGFCICLGRGVCRGINLYAVQRSLIFLQHDQRDHQNVSVMVIVCRSYVGKRVLITAILQWCFVFNLFLDNVPQQCWNLNYIKSLNTRCIANRTSLRGFSSVARERDRHQQTGTTSACVRVHTCHCNSIWFTKRNFPKEIIVRHAQCRRCRRPRTRRDIGGGQARHSSTASLCMGAMRFDGIDGSNCLRNSARQNQTSIYPMMHTCYVGKIHVSLGLAGCGAVVWVRGNERLTISGSLSGPERNINYWDKQESLFRVSGTFDRKLCAPRQMRPFLCVCFFVVVALFVDPGLVGIY